MLSLKDFVKIFADTYNIKRNFDIVCFANALGEASLLSNFYPAANYAKLFNTNCNLNFNLIFPHFHNFEIIQYISGMQ